MNLIKRIHKTVSEFALNKNKQKQFLWLTALVCVSIFSYNLYIGITSYVFIFVTLICIVLSFTYPKTIIPFLYLWVYFGKILSEITSTVILFLLFFFGILPMKIFLKKDKLKNSWNKVKGESNFNEQF